MPKGGAPGEFEIIARFLAPLADDFAGARGLLDDAAFLETNDAGGLVVTMDTLVAGVHFRVEDRPEHVAHKALAVNISDLAAKGAEPLVYLLSLSLPGVSDADWLEAFASGLRTAQETFGCQLAGGDTVSTPGPLTLTITAIGRTEAEGMVLRSGAAIGESIYVTGTIGDAALGLKLLQDTSLAHRLRLDESDAAYLKSRYWIPQPRLAAISLLRDFATAAMDISDGLVGDLAKLCRASNVGAAVQSSAVPTSDAAARALRAEPDLLEALLTGGDDYEILATVSARKSQEFERACRNADLSVMEIGQIVETEAGVSIQGGDGQLLNLSQSSFDHFDPRPS